MQASTLLLRWGSYRWACHLWVLIIYLFFSQLFCPLWFQGSPQTLQWECFLVFGNFSLFKTPFPRQSSVPTSFVSLSLFFFFSLLSFIFFPNFFWSQWAAFLAPWCRLPGFRSCFVEFTQHLNVLLMNLLGIKWSPRPIPLSSTKAPQSISFKLKKIIKNHTKHKNS